MSHITITYVHTLRTALHKGAAPAIMADAVADMAHDCAMNGGALDKARAVVADCQSTDKGKPRTPAVGTFPAMVLAMAQRVIATSADVKARPEHKGDHGGDIALRRERAAAYAAAIRAEFVAMVAAAADARKAAADARKAQKGADAAAGGQGDADGAGQGADGADGAGQGEGTSPESTDGLKDRIAALVAERDALAAAADALRVELQRVTAERDALAAAAAAAATDKARRAAGRTRKGAAAATGEALAA